MDMLTDPNRQTVIRLPEHSTRVQLLWKLQTDTHTHTNRTGVTVSPGGFNIAFQQLGQKEASHRHSDRKRRDQKKKRNSP